MSSNELQMNLFKQTTIEEQIEFTSKNQMTSNGKKKCKQSGDCNNKRFCSNNNNNNNDSNNNYDDNILEDNSCVNSTINTNQNQMSLNYLPKLFLRCHCKNNDPFDNETAIWSASFQPTIKDGNESRFVATCGANMVCIIDCGKTSDSNGQTVIARYIDNDINENLVCLAWNVVPFNHSEDCNQNDEQPILAVGGLRSILLMATNQFHCYERISDAHIDQINALIFNQNDLLFSASYDLTVKLWRISLPNDTKVTQCLKTVETRNNMLSLCFSSKYNTLIGSGHQGITFWSNACDINKELVLGHIRTSRLVDGLHIIPDDHDSIAVRIDESNSITIINLKKAIDEMMNSSSKLKMKPILLSKVQRARLESFEEKYPFVYLSARKNLLVSGGPSGKIWLYRTDKLKDYYDSKVVVKPDRIIEWPAFENIFKDNRKVIDDTKFVIVNTVAISDDLKYIVGCTNINLISIWRHPTAK